MREKATITQVYREVRAIRRLLEEMSERGILQSLGTEQITDEESKELDEAFEEVKRGKFVTLEKVKRG